MATLLDLVFHGLVSKHRRETFDPEKYLEHRKLAAAAKRNTAPPADIPTVTPIAIRPQGWSLTAALTTPPEPVVVEIEGHEAHERLQALLT